MISSPLQPQQIISAHPSQYPELLEHAEKWSSPSACERTVSEKGYTMIEIHTMMCKEKGITERLATIKQKIKKRKEQQKKHKGVKQPCARTQTKGKGKVKDSDSDNDSDNDSDIEDVTDLRVPKRARVGVGITFGIPEQILDEDWKEGEKYYLITWRDKPASLNSWEKASEYDGGVYDGAYVQLVQDWEEYRPTDPQYATYPSTSTTTSSSTSSNKHDTQTCTSATNTQSRKRKRQCS